HHPTNTSPRPRYVAFEARSTSFVRVRLPLLSVVFGSLCALTACGGGSVSPTPPRPQQTQLTVTLAGSGNVTSSPSGINCPTTCTANFSSETTVTLTATPAIGFNFSGPSVISSATIN